jgi:hypothetical protein
MMNLKKLGFAIPVLAATFTVPMYAHHSQSQFDLTKIVTVSGVVSEVDWANPHSFYYMDVKGSDGKSINWAFEGNAPNALQASGWVENTIKVGDKVTFAGNPRKDGKPTMLLDSVTLSNGQNLRSKAR